jgi:hypothetical protein
MKLQAQRVLEAEEHVSGAFLYALAVASPPG